MIAFLQKQKGVHSLKTQGKSKIKGAPNGTMLNSFTEISISSRTFGEWLTMADNLSYSKEIRSFAFEKAEKLASRPIELLELYFEAGVDGFESKERKIVARIKASSAPAEEWRKFLLRTNPTKLSAFVVEEKLGRARLTTLYANAFGDDKVSLGEHLGVPKVSHGKKD